jgi:hypothetical protein
MARCPDCNKFVAYDDSQDPEHNVDVDPEGRISGDVRVFLACNQCGTELKEGSFDVEKDLSVEFEEHVKKGGSCTASLLNRKNDIEFEIEFDIDDLSKRDEVLKQKLSELPDSESIEIVEVSDPEHELEAEAESEITVERKKGKNYYGHHTTVTITCSCKKFEMVEEFNDEIASGEMAELN